MTGSWVVSPASERSGVRTSYVSTLEDKSRPIPHPDLGPPYVVYEKYRTADVLNIHEELIPWSLSFVRSDDFTNLSKDSNVLFVFRTSFNDLRYFLGKTYKQNGMGRDIDSQASEIRAHLSMLESKHTGRRLARRLSLRADAAVRKFKRMAENENTMWESLSAIGQVLRPGWTPYGTWVPEDRQRRRGRK